MSGTRKLIAILMSALAFMTVGIAPASAAAPDAPTGVSAVAVDFDSASVSWTASTIDLVDPVVEYVITPVGEPGLAVTIPGETATTGTVDGLTPGVSYTFFVTAVNGIPQSSADSAVSNAVVPNEVPGQPALPTAGTVTDSSIVVNWTAPANNGSAITGYTVTATGGPSSQTTGDVATTTFSSLSADTEYTFTVAAINGAGQSTPSAVLTVSTIATPASAPDKPDAPTTSSPTSASITVSWNAPAANGSTIGDYVVTASNGAGDQSVNGATSLVFTGLNSNTAYTFTVLAESDQGDSPTSDASASASTLAPPASAPDAPNAPTVSSPTQTSIAVSWSAPAANGSNINGYVVTASNGGGTQNTTGATSLVFAGLTANSSYTFTVRATSDQGDSPTSAASASASTSAGVPGTPGAPTGSVASSTSIDVSWTAPATNGSAITLYTVVADNGGGTQTTAGTTSVTFSGLTTGTPYKFTVQATNGVGVSGISGESAAATPAGVPGTSGTPTASVASSTSVLLNWAAAPANGAAVTYTVTASPGGATRTTGGTSLTFNSLTTGTEYTFTVAAANSIGAGGTSPASAASTPAGAPAKPAKPSIGRDANVSNVVTVTWAAPNANGSPITGYHVTLLPGPHEADVAAGVLTVDFSSLTSGDYTATVVATNALGDSAASNASDSQNVPHVPGQVTNIQAVTTTPFGHVIEVSWDPPTDDGGSEVLSYTVKFGAVQATVASDVSSVTIGPLPVGTHVAEINANTVAGPGLTLMSNSVEVQGETGFIEQQYADFLGRDADAGGLGYWQTQTHANEANTAEIIVRFMRSNEFAPSRSVARLYLAYFKRDPDLEGFDFWYKLLASNGGTIETVSQSFATGAEFDQRYGKLLDRAFVEQVYLNVLGRSGEEEGVVFWTGQLAAGMTRGEMMTMFSESPENIVATSAQVDVIVTYRGMLDRKPDAEGRAFWVELIGTDANAIYSLVANFYNLPEYQARVR